MDFGRGRVTGEENVVKVKVGNGNSGMEEIASASGRGERERKLGRRESRVDESGGGGAMGGMSKERCATGE